MELIDRDPELLLRPRDLRFGDPNQIARRQGVVECLLGLQRDLEKLIADAGFGCVLRRVRGADIRESPKTIEQLDVRRQTTVERRARRRGDDLTGVRVEARTTVALRRATCRDRRQVRANAGSHRRTGVALVAARLHHRRLHLQCALHGLLERDLGDLLRRGGRGEQRAKQSPHHQIPPH